jgi:hypothetical protein
MTLEKYKDKGRGKREVCLIIYILDLGLHLLRQNSSDLSYCIASRLMYHHNLNMVNMIFTVLCTAMLSFI